MLNQGQRLHWFCDYDILTCGTQNHCAFLHEKDKKQGLSHVLGWGYEPGLETLCITLHTFHQLEFSYVATHNGREEWKMIDNFMIKRRLKYFDEHLGSLYHDDFTQIPLSQWSLLWSVFINLQSVPLNVSFFPLQFFSVALNTISKSMYLISLSCLLSVSP